MNIIKSIFRGIIRVILAFVSLFIAGIALCIISGGFQLEEEVVAYCIAAGAVAFILLDISLWLYLDKKMKPPTK